MDRFDLAAAILSSLSETSPLAPGELRRRTAAACKRRFSAKQFETELRELQLQGAVTITRSGCRRCRARILDVIDPAAKTSQRTWSFHSLGSCLQFLHQVELSLLNAAEHRTLYQCLSHPWPMLHRSYRRLLIEHAVRSIGGRSVHIVSHMTSLGTALARRWTNDVYFFLATPRPNAQVQPTSVVCLSGDHVLLTQTDTKTAAAVGEVFRYYQTPDEIPSWKLRELFQTPAGILVSLTGDRREVEALERRLAPILRLKFD